MRNLKAFNHALLGKWFWRLKIENNYLWGRVLKEKYGVLDGEVGHGGRWQSVWWSDIQKLEKECSGFKQQRFSSCVQKVVGNGMNTFFWTDPWINGGTLKERYSRLFSLCMNKEGVVVDFVRWQDSVGEWSWRWRRRLFQWEREKLCELQGIIMQMGVKGDGADKWVWLKDSTGIYSFRSAYKWLCLSDFSGDVNFYNHLWRGGVPLKIKAFVWKLAQDRVPTLINLARRNVILFSVLCKGCEKEGETSEHLFFKCEFFSFLWRDVLKWWGLSAPLHGACKAHFLQFSGLVGAWDLVWSGLL